MDWNKILAIIGNAIIVLALLGFGAIIGMAVLVIRILF